LNCSFSRLSSSSGLDSLLHLFNVTMLHLFWKISGENYVETMFGS
jgi:hypothetical protein